MYAIAATTSVSVVTAGFPSTSCSTRDLPGAGTLRYREKKFVFHRGVTFHSATLNTGWTPSRKSSLLRFPQKFSSLNKSICSAGDSDVVTRTGEILFLCSSVAVFLGYPSVSLDFV